VNITTRSADRGCFATVIEWEISDCPVSSVLREKAPLEDGDEDGAMQLCGEVSKAAASEDASRTRTTKLDG